MTQAPIPLGNVGVAIIARVVDENGVVRDISTATSLKMRLRKPGGPTVTKDAAFTTNGADGRLQYITQYGDLDASGLWQFQGEYSLGGLKLTEIGEFQVAYNL